VLSKLSLVISFLGQQRSLSCIWLFFYDTKKKKTCLVEEEEEEEEINI
jgi:hypothetical protein